MNAIRRAGTGPVERVRGVRVLQKPTRPASVTVVIPCFNYERFLPQAVASALDQRDAMVDVVIVDDKSDDGSLALARSLAVSDSRVRVIAHERNLGPVETFNHGLAEVTGEYLIRLDADDLLTPGSIARATALAEQYPSVGMVYGCPVAFTDAVPTRHRDRSTSWDIWSGHRWLQLRCELGVNCITSPEVLMRSSVVDRVGGQRNLAHTHDMEMWFRLARDSDVGWVGGSDQAWHRDHSESRSAKDVDVMVDFRERRLAYETLFDDGIGDLADNMRLLSEAKSALANEALSRTASAFAKGRGGSDETDGYLSFARELGVDLHSLPASRFVEHAERLGPRRAAHSPLLITWAGVYRLSREIGAPRRRARGI